MVSCPFHLKPRASAAALHASTPGFATVPVGQALVAVRPGTNCSREEA
eukprot:CAMPEP_0195113972 /NCGR_PEP_ID=MMETSP0448-20130528/104513_1 /TAXON_ID=66468 /ORGANISM="Heterocapsa triquestra, Strain CCMP 448" /LENGTH=47 /DNA_ID= /DNA_START= /DNA_END= /DNA_ORIENTATION=